MLIEPRATYRVQLHAGFTLDDAAQIIDYLQELGISHLYSSPSLQAVEGSPHGYDVVDPTRINRELGGEEAFRRLIHALQKKHLSLMMDIVPNHMSVSGADNPWWWDVLENGPSSRFAAHFDVEWDPPETRHSNAVLIPVLGDHYGRVLEAGELRLVFSTDGFEIHYHDNRYPVDPSTYNMVLSPAARAARSADLHFLANAFASLPHEAASDRMSARRRNQDARILRTMLKQWAEGKQLSEAIQNAVQKINADHDALDSLLQAQNFRLAFWKVSSRELGYRRFFDINTLIGLRMEDENVFEDTHARIIDWIKEGWLDGLRIDHPDGLRDPLGYFERLRTLNEDLWVVIEKIVEPGEDLPAHWPVDGTTGYDFMYRMNHVLLHPDGEAELDDFYARFCGQDQSYQQLRHQLKKQAAEQVLGSDLNRLTFLLESITEGHRRYRDYTRAELREAVAELAACMPVYRTYVRPQTGEVSEHDRLYVAHALETAVQNSPALDPFLFEFIGSLLLLKITGPAETEFVQRFQQFTGPVMAKGMEDTVFYNYNRLVSLNEVGGDPGHFALPVEEFQRACMETAEKWPRSLLATSTHDTKRSEDVRARLNVLSEIPERWAEAVTGWSRMLENLHTGGMPDRLDEYLLYQTLVGAWPIDTQRTRDYMLKAAREAKRRTTWTAPDETYEQALLQFIQKALANPDFTTSLDEFVSVIRTAGWVNSLAQTLVKLTSPGVPDIYQGCELWALSLVDPDNRRPVDYAARRALLRELRGMKPAAIWERRDEGLPKLWLIHAALELRARKSACFTPGSRHMPVDTGTENAVAYLRAPQDGEAEVAVIFQRYFLSSGGQMGDATLCLPGTSWVNVLTHHEAQAGEIPLHALLEDFPVALLERK